MKPPYNLIEATISVEAREQNKGKTRIIRLCAPFCLLFSLGNFSHFHFLAKWWYSDSISVRVVKLFLELS